MNADLGQGLNNAGHDVASLAQQMQEKGGETQSAVLSALAAYEEEIWQQGEEAVTSSLENSIATHNWDALGNKSYLVWEASRKPQTRIITEVS